MALQNASLLADEKHADHKTPAKKFDSIWLSKELLHEAFCANASVPDALSVRDTSH